MPTIKEVPRFKLELSHIEETQLRELIDEAIDANINKDDISRLKIDVRLAVTKFYRELLFEIKNV